MWSPDHVKIGLKLHKIANKDIIDNNKFVILSSSNAADDANTNKNSKDKKRKRFAVKQPGLSLEAFRLSDQAYRLFQKGNHMIYINYQYLFYEIGTISVSKDIENDDSNKLSKGKKVKSDTGDDNKELIKLEGPVLTGNSNEATAIDPLLLAVPLPIIQIGAISNANSNNNVNDFEHSFPTFHEIDNDQKLKKSANIHLYRTLGYIYSSLATSLNYHHYYR
jgi:hypothetical protein